MKEITVGEIRKIIREGSSEFKPVLGDKVEKENKKNNGKTYSDSKTRFKAFEKGGFKPSREPKSDFNKTTLNYNPFNIDDKTKERYKAQALGYASTLEMNNKLPKEGDFEGNKAIYKDIKDEGEAIEKQKKAVRNSGIQTSNMKNADFERKTMYESQGGYEMRKLIDKFKQSVSSPKSIIKENKNIKTIHYKKTEFLTEGHMASIIPDEFRENGKQFIMKDKTGNEYLVEWNNNKANILEHSNKQGFNESVNRMKELYNYKSSVRESSKSYHLMENQDSVRKFLDKTKALK